MKSVTLGDAPAPADSVAGARPRGKARAADIVAAARTVLTDGGYAGFTLRNVADAAGVRLSHLQYYYATKGDLVRGLLAAVGAEYERHAERVFASVPDTPTARFMAWIDFLLDDCWDPRTRHFFIQLWGLLESEDAYAGTLLQEFYAVDIRAVADLVRALSPHLDEATIGRRATIIAGIIEGTMLMIGSEPPDSGGRGGLLAEVRRQIFRIASEV